MDEGRKDSLKWWVLFIIVMGALCYMIYQATARAYPDMLDLIVGMMVISVGVAAFNHYNADEPDAAVRCGGLAALVLIALLDVLNLWGHISLARDLSVAHAGEIETRDREQWQEQLKDKDAARQKELNESRAKLNETESTLASAHARKLNAVPRSERGIVARSLVVGQGATGVTAAVPSATPAISLNTTVASTAPADDAESVGTETQVKRNWRGFFTKVSMATILVSVLCAAGLIAMKRWDGNGNGIPDYKDRIRQREGAMGNA